jgi:hypothetical protein
MSLHKRSFNDNKPNPKVIYNQDGILAKRYKKGSYSISVNLKNECFDLYSLIDFETLPLIAEINKRLFESIQVEKESDTSGKIVIIFRDLFKMFGIKQKYLYIHGEKTENLSKTSKEFAIKNMKSSKFPNHLDQLEFGQIKFKADKISETHVFVDCNLSFVIAFPLPTFVEKLAIQICMRFVAHTKNYFESLKEFTREQV